MRTYLFALAILPLLASACSSDKAGTMSSDDSTVDGPDDGAADSADSDAPDGDAPGDSDSDSDGPGDSDDPGGSDPSIGEPHEVLRLDQCKPGAASTPTQAQIDLLKAGGSVSGTRVLYPYDGTVFPRGLKGPLLMWDGVASTEAVYVHIKSTSFVYDGCFKVTCAQPAAAAEGRVGRSRPQDARQARPVQRRGHAALRRQGAGPAQAEVDHRPGHDQGLDLLQQLRLALGHPRWQGLPHPSRAATPSRFCRASATAATRCPPTAPA